MEPTGAAMHAAHDAMLHWRPAFPWAARLSTATAACWTPENATCLTASSTRAAACWVLTYPGVCPGDFQLLVVRAHAGHKHFSKRSHVSWGVCGCCPRPTCNCYGCHPGTQDCRDGVFGLRGRQRNWSTEKRHGSISWSGGPNGLPRKLSQMSRLKALGERCTHSATSTATWLGDEAIV